MRGESWSVPRRADGAELAPLEPSRYSVINDEVEESLVRVTLPIPEDYFPDLFIVVTQRNGDTKDASFAYSREGRVRLNFSLRVFRV